MRHTLTPRTLVIANSYNWQAYSYVHGLLRNERLLPAPHVDFLRLQLLPQQRGQPHSLLHFLAPQLSTYRSHRHVLRQRLRRSNGFLKRGLGRHIRGVRAVPRYRGTSWRVHFSERHVNGVRGRLQLKERDGCCVGWERWDWVPVHWDGLGGQQRERY